MKDYFNREIQVGDLVVYGKSSRYAPLSVGVVQRVLHSVMEVLGHGNTKPGKIECYSEDNGVNKRVVILPESLMEHLDE